MNLIIEFKYRKILYYIILLNASINILEGLYETLFGSDYMASIHGIEGVVYLILVINCIFLEYIDRELIKKNE